MKVSTFSLALWGVVAHVPTVQAQLRSSNSTTGFDYGSDERQHRELFTCGSESLPSFGPSVNPEAAVRFVALADGPYGTDDRYCLNFQLRQDLSDIEDPFFYVHLGDIKTGGSRCDEAAFKDVAKLFANPKNAIHYDPKDWFFLVGDNEWNDCGDEEAAWRRWIKYYGAESSYGFGSFASGGVQVARQTDVERLPGVDRSENFAFFEEGVLFVGLHMVGGGTVGDESTRVAQNFDWVKENLRMYKNEIKAAVVFGHARMGGERRRHFGLPFMALLREEFSSLPVLYVHGDGHDYCVNYVDSKNPNLVEVELEDVGSAPPVLISVLRNPQNGAHIFDIDRRGGSYSGRCPKIVENTWNTPDGPRLPPTGPPPTPPKPSPSPPTGPPPTAPKPSPSPVQPPTPLAPLGVQFSLVTANLGLVVEPADLDRSIDTVELYINDNLVRREGKYPYEWGTANVRETDQELLNLAAREYKLRAKAIASNGETTDTTISVLIDLCPDDPEKMEPGRCGCGKQELVVCDDDVITRIDEVVPSDTILVKPDSQGPIVAPITAYTWKDSSDWPDALYELPIYKDLNRNNDEYWNFLVDELLLSRVDVVMFHGRGCWDLSSGFSGTGDLCPRHLSKFVSAVDRAGARHVIRVGMWDDTATYNKAKQHLENLPSGTKLDLSNSNDWKYVWDHNIKIWFDTLPEEMWFLMDGKPVIAFWNLRDRYFVNQQGNASKMLDWIIANFIDRYGMEPALVLQDSWFENDSTIGESQAVGMHGWFKPVHDVGSSLYSYSNYNGEEWGVVAPSFRNGGGSSSPGCGEVCREVTRRDGERLEEALAAGTNAKFILLEGWTNMAESAGFYRSLDWSYPTQYINIVRRYADPEPETLRFQAEGADRFSDFTSDNLGGEYANRALDVGKLDDNTGWYVGWTQAGEWLEYQGVEFGCGTYRFTARVATKSAGKQLRLDLGGLPIVELPETGGLDKYELVHLGAVKLGAGKHDLKLVVESTSGLNIDWFFLKRNSTDCTI